jgi:hypothetical protein
VRLRSVALEEVAVEGAARKNAAKELSISAVDAAPVADEVAHVVGHDCQC